MSLKAFLTHKQFAGYATTYRRLLTMQARYVLALMLYGHSTVLQMKWFLVIPATPSLLGQIRTDTLDSLTHRRVFHPQIFLSKHFLQNECRLFSVRGSSNVSRQIEHSSRLFRSCFWFAGGKLLAEAIFNEAGLVVFKKAIKNEVKMG